MNVLLIDINNFILEARSGPEFMSLFVPVRSVYRDFYSLFVGLLPISSD